MHNKLKIHVLQMIYGERPENISEEVYQRVLSYVTEYIHEFCLYIFRSVEYELVQEKIPLSDQNILSKLSSTYCFKKSNEYLQFLENTHEYAHEAEQLAR